VAPGTWTTPPTAPRGTSGFAIAALVLGILWIWGLGSVLALIFGFIGKNQIDTSRGQLGGRGMAIAGIVLGILGIIGAIVLIIAIAIASNNNPTPPY
jgi:hypothetical protein